MWWIWVACFRAGEAPSAVPSVGGPRAPLELEALPPGELAVSPALRLGAQRHPLSAQRVVRAGEEGAEGPIGQARDHQGQPILREGKPLLCNLFDGATIMPDGQGGLLHLLHGECHPGLVMSTELRWAEGRWTGSGTRTLHLPAPGGLSGVGLPCAASLSPWGTHLLAEEYEPDAALAQAAGTVSDNHFSYNRRAWYFGELAGRSPYAHGLIRELVLQDGQIVQKPRPALGRFSHELARVMPDRRTVYLTDDGPRGVLFLFVADRPDDLSAGQLYAARLDPEGALVWIPLGHAEEGPLLEVLAGPGPRFDEIFEEAPAGDCPVGFGRAPSWEGERCLRPRPGQELLASRLESRRVAALAGATTEWRKMEGLDVDPRGRRLYVALTEVEGGMLEGAPSLSGVDSLRLAQNRCGTIWSMPLERGQRDSAGAPIASDWVARSAGPFLSGVPEGEGCSSSAIANPDNLVVMPEAGVLLVAEDSHHHAQNLLWMVELESRRAQPLLRIPEGAEVAGLGWWPELPGGGWISATVQQGRVDPGAPIPPEKASEALLIGPFPRAW